MTLESLDRAIANLEQEIKDGQDFPFRGYCGEDDARQDQLESLKLERDYYLRSLVV